VGERVEDADEGSRVDAKSLGELGDEGAVDGLRDSLSRFGSGSRALVLVDESSESVVALDRAGCV
jgi:hypothetical protein